MAQNEQVCAHQVISEVNFLT